MMTSAAKAFGHNCLGVIMTGMGRDGVNGCGAIRNAGGYVLGQDQATSDVYGMNKVAFVEGNVDQQFSLHDAAAMIYRQIRKVGTEVASS
jgi:two-component system chemotaxis response regulator CheB